MDRPYHATAIGLSHADGRFRTCAASRGPVYRDAGVKAVATLVPEVRNGLWPSGNLQAVGRNENGDPPKCGRQSIGNLNRIPARASGGNLSR